MALALNMIIVCKARFDQQKNFMTWDLSKDLSKSWIWSLRGPMVQQILFSCKLITQGRHFEMKSQFTFFMLTKVFFSIVSVCVLKENLFLKHLSEGTYELQSPQDLKFRLSISTYLTTDQKWDYHFFMLPKEVIKESIKKCIFLIFHSWSSCTTSICTTIWIDMCTLDVAISSITPKPYILQKILFLWRLWAEIEVHKWRDLELNLSKTATKAIKFY